jgi:hypothetical protein
MGDASGRFIYCFYLLPNTNPSGHLAPSSHRMRDNPFFGSIHPKIPRDKETEGNNAEKW